MDSSVSLLDPYKTSFAYDETERQLQALFIAVFDELFGDQIKNIHDYGMPHLGSAAVVERFTKQDGLVVLRPSAVSDIIMRVIYANWRSLSSKRGLAFLEFVLTMIWGNQWEINRLYHSIEMSNQYPTLTTVEETYNSFLTSRISITIDQAVNADEIRDLAPMISKLVPANIVAKIMTGMTLENMDEIGIGMACIPYAASNLEYFAEIDQDRIQMTDWIIQRIYTLTDLTVRYTAFKTDLIDAIYSFADVDLRNLAKSALVLTEFQQLSAVRNAVKSKFPEAAYTEFLTSESKVIALSIPINFSVDTAAASEVIVARFTASGNGEFVGNAEFMPVMDYLGWIYLNGEICKTSPASSKYTQKYMYQAEPFVSYVSYYQAAHLKMNDLVQNSPEWAGRTLDGGLILDSSEISSETYLQKYTFMTPEPTYTDGISDASAFYFHHEFDSQAWKFETADAVFEAFKTYWNDGHADASGNITGLRSADVQPDESVSYDAIYESDPDLSLPVIIQRTENPHYDPLAASVPSHLENGEFRITVYNVPNPDFVSENAIGYVEVLAAEKADCFGLALTNTVNDGNTAMQEKIFSAMKKAYFKDNQYSQTNMLFSANLSEITFDDIYLNMMNTYSTANHESAEYSAVSGYLNQIADTAFYDDVNKQLVRVSELKILLSANESA